MKLVEHKGSGSNSAGLCYFPDGSDYYAALVYDGTGSSHSIDELLEMTEKQRKSDLLAINGIAASHPGISLTTDDFLSLFCYYIGFPAAGLYGFFRPLRGPLYAGFHGYRLLSDGPYR